MKKVLFLLITLSLAGCSTATKQNVSSNQKTLPLPNSNETKTNTSWNQVSTWEMKEIENIIDQVLK